MEQPYRVNQYGAKRARTADPLHAMQVLYQLSYSPVGLINNHLPSGLPSRDDASGFCHLI